jgi:YYY domain-containing protein
MIREGVPLHFEYWYYGTRVIPHTINEFPFFTFLFADLHPHLIGIPFTILVVGLAVSWLWNGGRSFGPSVVGGILTVVALGALGGINTWDLPAYAVLLACVMLYSGYMCGGWKGVLVGGGTSLLILPLSLLAYGPFYIHYRAQYVGLGIVSPDERTRLVPFLVIWGFYVFLAFSVALFWTGRSWAWSRLADVVKRRGLGRTLHHLWGLKRKRVVTWVAYSLSLAGLLVLGVFLLVSSLWLWALLAPILGLMGLTILCSVTRRASFLRRLMAFAALAILWLVEIVYMRDFLAGSEWRRMNTVFKFYIQAWVLLGLAMGGTLPILWHRLRSRWGALWKGVFALGLVSSLVYTALAVPARVTQRFPNARPPIGTLDGTAYMKTAVYAWPDEEDRIELKYDRQAIAWLWDNVRGTPVLAEAPLPYYREGGLRVCSYTGLPTIIGAHENEQRPWEQLGSRQEDAEAIFESTDLKRVRQILAKYRVRYVYVGQLERNAYDAAGLAKFSVLVDQGAMTRVFQNAGVDIYKVVEYGDV